jgi:hypothetical protein
MSKRHEQSRDTIDVVARSGRTFTLKELNGLEQTRADRAASDPMAMISYRAAMAIVAIDGAPQSPVASDLDLEARLQQLAGSELDALITRGGRDFAHRPGRTFTLRELNGLEQTRADRAAKDPMAMISYRAVAAVATVDGHEAARVKDESDLEARLAELRASELDAIVREYGERFNLTDEELGNASASVGSQPS